MSTSSLDLRLPEEEEEEEEGLGCTLAFTGCICIQYRKAGPVADQPQERDMKTTRFHMHWVIR